MSISAELRLRCGSNCELCNAEQELRTYVVPPKSGLSEVEQVALCLNCLEQVQGSDAIVPNHWRCLNESIWNPQPAVQVVAFRMLQKLSKEEWAADLQGMMYMEDSTREWANLGDPFTEEKLVHKDSNGQILLAGDSVVLIKDLNVKGANFIAKRGTAVRRISLIHDNVEHIQGRVNDQTIIILTKFVKKS